MAVTLNASASAGLITTADTSTVLQFQSNGTTTATIDASGNLGIGTTSPTTPLGAGNTGLVINNTTTNQSKIQLQNSTSGTTASDGGLFSFTGTDVYLWNYENGPIVFGANNSEQMRLTSTGLGIGTTSPTFASGTGVQINNPASADTRLRLTNAGTGTGNFDGFDLAVTSAGQVNLIGWENQPMTFLTNATERARIDSSGNLLVGATAGSCHKFYKSVTDGYATIIENGTTGNPYGLQLYYSGKSGLSTVNELYLRCNDVTATRMYVMSNGGIGNYSGNNVNLSDRREKTNFSPSGSYLDKICAIPVQTYNYIDQDLEQDPDLTLGVVAQDVQAVAPELVTESNWGTEEAPKMRLSIYQTDLQYALMKCIQEQQALITQLQADVAALKGAQA